jgi:hypothetical protein
MPVLIAISILLILPLVILGLETRNPKPGYLWLLALGGAFLAWLLILLVYTQLPLSIALIDWSPDTFFIDSPSLLVDHTSWPYALAVTTMILAVLLTDVAHVGEIEPTTWAASLAMGGVGLLAVLAGNPLTILLTWAFTDLAETWALLVRVAGSDQRERVVMSFSVRVAGLLCLILALIEGFRFDHISIPVSGYLLLAAGLRLGVIPPHAPFLQGLPLRRGLGTLLRLVPVAASLMLLTRTAAVGAPQSWMTTLLVLAGFAVVFSSVNWVRARTELSGRANWIFGMATLAFVAAMRADPQSSLAWGLALLFSGSFIFLAALRHRILSFGLLLGVVGITGLPFTPLASGTSFYSGISPFFVIVFILGQALLLIGYLRHAFRQEEIQADIERWIWVVYPLGLIVLPLAHFITTYMNGGLPESAIFPGWWGGLAASGLAAILMVVPRPKIAWPTGIQSALGEFFSLSWLYRFLWWLYRLLSGLINSLSLVLEGEGGVLWAILMLILVLMAFVQQGRGG